MQNQLQPEETNAPPTLPAVTTETPTAAHNAAETQAAQKVRERLAEIQQKMRRDKRRFWRGLLCFETLLALALFLAGFFPHVHDVASKAGVAALFLLAMGMFFAFVLVPLCWKPSWNAEEFAQAGGVSAIPTLIEMLFPAMAGWNQQPVLAALITLLPQMKASDAHLLSRSHRNRLNDVLRFEGQPGRERTLRTALRVAILQALEQVGDSTSIPTVEHLANGRARRPEQQQVKQAAIECLAALRVHSGEIEANQTLLRAAQSVDSAPETLLRPASGAGETAPDELLRAANSDVGDGFRRE